MDCERCSGIMVELIHGELSPEERASAMEHIRGCEECRREYEEYAEIRRAVTEDASLPEPSPEVMERLSGAARKSLSGEKRPFWMRWSYSPILIPALTTAIALVVWFYYGHTGGRYTETTSRDMLASRVKEPRSYSETTGQAAPELKKESAAPGEKKAPESRLSSRPAAPPPPEAREMYSAVLNEPGVKGGREASNKESPLFDSSLNEPVPKGNFPPSQTEEASHEKVKEWVSLLRLALKQQSEGDCRASIGTNEALLRSSPEPPADVLARSYRSLAECYEKEGQLDKAVMSYTRLGKVSPGEASFANRRISEIREKSVERMGSATPTPGPVN